MLEHSSGLGEVQYVNKYQFGTLNISDIASLHCTFNYRGQEYAAAAEIRQYGENNYATIVNCPMPRELDDRLEQTAFLNYKLHVNLVWIYHDYQGSHVHSFVMKNRLTPKEQDVSQFRIRVYEIALLTRPGFRCRQLGVCVSPLWGRPQTRDLLEWRENARAMGVNVVHWHARDASVEAFVEDLNHVTNSQDTFTHAPPMDPWSYMTGNEELLMDDGKYGDQVSGSNDVAEWMLITGRVSLHRCCTISNARCAHCPTRPRAG